MKNVRNTICLFFRREASFRCGIAIAILVAYAQFFCLYSTPILSTYMIIEEMLCRAGHEDGPSCAEVALIMRLRELSVKREQDSNGGESHSHRPCMTKGVVLRESKVAIERAETKMLLLEARKVLFVAVNTNKFCLPITKCIHNNTSRFGQHSTA